MTKKSWVERAGERNISGKVQVITEDRPNYPPLITSLVFLQKRISSLPYSRLKLCGAGRRQRYYLQWSNLYQIGTTIARKSELLRCNNLIHALIPF